MVLLIKKTDFLIVYKSKGEKESVLMSLRTAGMTSSRLRYFLVKLGEGVQIGLDNSWRITVDHRMHNRCCACAYQLLCKRTTAVVRP